ncbi:helix-turn-helix domain-containing protein [Ancylobacter sp. VNQ12]|uniref:helix-turn-helix domain-containing protein n=1 Tax=Ancylobacter sp. VNQ12 TaxID=3400920 RepID=UPI003C0702DA
MPASVPALPPDPCRLAAEIAARHTELPVEDVLLAGRGDRRLSSARALAMYLAHVGLGEPMRAVARGFHRHPSTVAHACWRIEERREVAGWDCRVAELEDEARRLMAGDAVGEAVGEAAHGA